VEPLGIDVVKRVENKAWGGVGVQVWETDLQSEAFRQGIDTAEVKTRMPVLVG